MPKQTGNHSTCSRTAVFRGLSAPLPRGPRSAVPHAGRPSGRHGTGLQPACRQIKYKSIFEKTEEFDWMIEHAHEYGFILRFPKDKEEETGYHFESWHYRYVGKDIAKYIKEHNISFEEYYATIIKDW